MKPINIFLLAVFVFAFGTGAASASHKVVLITGDVMTVDQARIEEDRVWISWSGLTLSIDKKDVLRIESGKKRHVIVHDKPSKPISKKPRAQKASSKSSRLDKPAKDKNKKKAKTTRATAGQKPKPHKPQNPPDLGRLSTSAEQFMAFLEPNGFAGVKWGDHPEPKAGFRKLNEDSELPEVYEYFRKNEPVQLGSETESPVVKYAFWKNRLYMVTLWAAGQEAYSSMRNAMIKRYGPGIQSPEKKQTFYWVDNNADRMIDYLEDKEVGMLWMRSREINHQYQLSQMRIPIHAGQNRPIPAGK